MTRRRAEVMASVKKDWASGEKSSGSDAMVSKNLFDDEMCFIAFRLRDVFLMFLFFL